MFKLKIRLGNAAMESPTDVRVALQTVIQKLQDAAGQQTGIIRDLNGNTVGQWTFIPLHRGAA